MSEFNFEHGIPKEARTECGGSIAVVGEQWKQGKHSLKWDFVKGSRLVFTTDIGYTKRTDGYNDSLTVYLYGFGGDGILSVYLKKADRICQHFEIVLGFDGWRSVRVGFDRDMYGSPEEGMNEVVFEADSNGVLLINQLVTAEKTDYRLVMASYQVPHIENRLAPIIEDREWETWQSVKHWRKSDIASIETKLYSFIMAEFGTVDVSVAELLDEFSHLEIKDGSMGVTGKRIENFSSEGVGVKKISVLALRLAVYYRTTGNKTMRDAYVELLKHLICQGFDEGSSFGTHFLLDYGLKLLYLSFFLMLECIKEVGLYDRIYKAALWFLHLGNRGFISGREIELATADDFNNTTQGMLVVALITENPERKAAYIKALSVWLNKSMQYADGLQGVFKEDGCIFHHGGHYPAYGLGALSGLAPVIYALSGTAFDVSPDTWENMKQTLYALRFQCNRLDIPVVFSGRHPLGNWKLDMMPFKYFALSALEKGDDGPVSVYLRLADKPKDSLERLLFESKIAPEDTPNGNRTFNMACANVHRRDEWLAVAKGFSKYLWGSEIYSACNLYGRYRSYGAVEIIHKPTLKESGFSHDGYDWRRFPGTTAVYIPLAELKAQVIRPDASCGTEEMLLSDQCFAGGNTLGQNGMFSMILKGHPKYNDTFMAYKSVFFIDDFILLMGSGIQDGSNYETETVLYQNNISDSEARPTLNGIPFCGEAVIEQDSIITDNKGNKYYLEKNTKIYMRNGEQISQSHDGSGETRGLFSVAVIRHGVNPINGQYVYGIGVNGAEKPNYKILRQDSTAHVVQFGDLTCMAIFKPEDFESVKVNVPLLLMFEKKGRELKIAVCDVDLGLYENDASQYNQEGHRIEAGIYSRGWYNNPIASRNVEIEFRELDISFSLQIKGGQVSTHTLML